MQTSHQRAIDDQERKHQVKKYSNYFRPIIFSSIMVVDILSLNLIFG